MKGLADKGFNPIELGGDLSMFLPPAFSPTSVVKLAALKADGLSYTLHLPLWSVEPSTPLSPVRRGSVEALVQTIQVTRPIEPEVVVLHATGALAAEFTNMKISELAKPDPAPVPERGARASGQSWRKPGCPAADWLSRRSNFPSR